MQIRTPRRNIRCWRRDLDGELESQQQHGKFFVGDLLTPILLVYIKAAFAGAFHRPIHFLVALFVLLAKPQGTRLIVVEEHRDYGAQFIWVGVAGVAEIISVVWHLLCTRNVVCLEWWWLA